MAKKRKYLIIDDLLNPHLGGAVNIKPLIENLQKRYKKNIRNKLKIGTHIDGDRIYIKAKVPSEENKGNYKGIEEVFYDVILQFDPVDQVMTESRTITQYKVKLYSNCPTFTYSFTYVHNHAGNLVDFIPKSFYLKKALTDKPIKRNQYLLTGVEKSVFYTLEAIKETDLLKKANIKLYKYQIKDTKYMLQLIHTQDEKLKELERLRIVIARKKAELKDKENEATRSKPNKVITKKKTKGLSSNLTSNIKRASSLKSTTTTSKLSIRRKILETKKRKELSKRNKRIDERKKSVLKANIHSTKNVWGKVR